MAPHETAPVPEHESCFEAGKITCPNNEFGTGKNGKGKACANTRLLAVVNPTEEDPTIYLLKVSATGIKPFDNYVQSVKTMYNTTPLGVITDIFFDPAERYGSLRFGNPKPNPKLEQHFALRARARELLLTPPDVSEYQPVEPKKGKK
jgi:hypothetical protein